MDMHAQAQRSRIDMHQMANSQSQSRMLVRKDSYIKSGINLPHIGGGGHNIARHSQSCVTCDEDTTQPFDAYNDELDNFAQCRTISPTDFITKETSLESNLSRYPMLPYIDGRHPISPSIQVKHIMGMEQDIQQRQIMTSKADSVLRHNARDHTTKSTKLPPIDYAQAQEDEQKFKRASMKASKRGGDSPEMKRVKGEEKPSSWMRKNCQCTIIHKNQMMNMGKQHANENI